MSLAYAMWRYQWLKLWDRLGWCVKHDAEVAQTRKLNSSYQGRS